MFYKLNEDETVSALVALTPSESKRLIARAVAEMPEVRRALKSGKVIIIGGTTNAFVAEELTGRDFPDYDKFWFASGRIACGELGANEPPKKIGPIVIKNGKEVDMTPQEALDEFTFEDVYIKGANAVDPDGNVGVLMASDTGGTIGASIGILKARGAQLIVPIGLEKLVVSVAEAAGKCGQGRFKYSTGDPAGLMPIAGAKVVTELEAVQILFGLRAVHVASGGVDGSEGSVVIAIEGDGAAVKRAFDFITSIKGERAVKSGE